MMWPWHKPPEMPDIPPPPRVEDTSADAKRMSELVKIRERRGRRLTRQTQHAIAQNNFVKTVIEVMGA